MERVVEQVVFPEKFPRMQNVAAYARVSSERMRCSILCRHRSVITAV